MSDENNFQYKPLNSTKRSRLRRFPRLPKLSRPSKLPKFPKFKKGQKKDWKQILTWSGIGIIGLIVAGFILLSVAIAILSIGLPDVKDLDKLSVAQSTTIYDREGNILYVKHGGENRQYIPFDHISETLVNATVAMEDDKFWTHSGFNLFGITRAVLGKVTGSAKGGGSTITQQYIKNAFLSPEKTYTRKLKELILAIRLEQEFDKQKIMELYLNKIPYGNNAYGVEKAAQVYFGKAAKDLNLPESVILASLPQMPSYYNPYGPHRNSELAKEFDPAEVKARNIRSERDLHDNEFLRGLIGNNIKLDKTHSVYIQGRTDLVLKAMNNTRYITKQEMEDALDDLQSIELKEYRESIAAPHFVFYVINQLEEQYGKEIVEQGGLQVYTSLDPTLQEYAETAVEEGTAANKEKYNVKNGALISLDPKTGEILAMVGSKDYFAEDIDGAVNITIQYRQPGSSFKPIVFAQAFYNRYAPASVIFDVKTRFGASAFPQNYDGTFMGPISIRKALGQSRNIPAIKAYFLAEGQEEIIKLSQKMGINFLDTEKDYGWPLALGTAEVRPLDIASAFGVFANTGVRHEPTAILKIENTQGEILEEYKPEESKGEEVLDPQIAYLINHILSDKSVGIGDNLVIPGKVTAAKTGTSNVKEGNVTLPRDLWTIGYSPNLVTAVWSGNNRSEDGKPAATASGLYTAGAIWKDFMVNALKDIPSEDFYTPNGITTASVSRLTGKLPGPNTPDSQIIEEIFASFSVPTEIDEGFTKKDIDTRNNKLANEYCPPKFVKTVNFLAIQAIAPINGWQESADAWLKENSLQLTEASKDEESTLPEEGVPEEELNISTIGDIVFGYPPVTTSELCSKSNLADKPSIKITYPKDKAEIESGTNIEVKIKINAPNKVEKVEYFLNSILQYTNNKSPYYGTIRFPKGETGTNRHEIKIIITDQYGYTSEKTITVKTTKAPTPPTEEEPEPEPAPTPELPPTQKPPEPIPTDELPSDNTPTI